VLSVIKQFVGSKSKEEHETSLSELIKFVAENMHLSREFKKYAIQEKVVTNVAVKELLYKYVTSNKKEIAKAYSHSIMEDDSSKKNKQKERSSFLCRFHTIRRTLSIDCEQASKARSYLKSADPNKITPLLSQNTFNNRTNLNLLKLNTAAA